MFYRLMRRSVLAQSDTVVGPHIDHVGLTQSRQSDARPHVVGKRKEGRGERHDAAMQGHARRDCSHGVLANAEVDVPPRVPQRTAHHSLGGWRTFGRRKLGALEITLALERGASGWIEVAR